MTIKITGDFSGLKRMTEETSKFTQAIEGFKPACDLLDPASVQAALRQIDEHVDREARRYSNNKMVKALADGLKTKMRQGVEEEARKAQAKHRASP